MPPEFFYAIAGIATYFVGAIPFGFLTAKWVGGVDLRQVGSGNIGATNTARALGGKWFFFVFAFDFLKGFAPAFWLASGVWNQWPCDTCPYGAAMMAVMCGVMAIGGHMWPIYLSFKGGKGVATGAGVVCALNGMAVGIALVVWLLIFFATRYVSLASIFAAIAIAVAQWVTASSTRFGEQALPVTIFCILLAGAVILKHRSNIRLLLRREEKKFYFSKVKDQ